MKASRFSSEQIIGILQEADRGEKQIRDLCRVHGITTTTYYRWRRKYGTMTVPEAQRLRDLERENVRLKRLLVERDLAIDALQEFLGKK